MLGMGSGVELYVGRCKKEEKMNITMEQLGELIAQAKSGRVTRELLQAFLRNPHGHNGKGEYPVTVDYGKTIEEMIAAGRYDWKNGDINSKNFSVMGKGTVETKLELVHLNKAASTKEVETYLEANGLRAATLEELLEFGATYPNIQREFPIVAIGSFWVVPDGDRSVPYLDRFGSRRALSLCWGDDDWDDVCRFLAVRK